MISHKTQIDQSILDHYEIDYYINTYKDGIDKNCNDSYLTLRIFAEKFLNSLVLG